MSNRPAPLSADEQADIGAVIGGLRGAGWGWKQLEEFFGMHRVQLWRCLRRHERMQQKTPLMQHL